MTAVNRWVCKHIVNESACGILAAFLATAFA
jgi:hypothetical protein